MIEKRVVKQWLIDADEFEASATEYNAADDDGDFTPSVYLRVSPKIDNPDMPAGMMFTRDVATAAVRLLVKAFDIKMSEVV